jgi:hypothetical protein
MIAQLTKLLTAIGIIGTLFEKKPTDPRKRELVLPVLSLALIVYLFIVVLGTIGCSAQKSEPFGECFDSFMDEVSLPIPDL